MKKAVTVILIVTMILGLILPTIAMAADTKEELNSINRKKEDVEDKINDAKNEKQEVEGELGKLEKQVQQAQKELASAESQLATANKNLESAKEEFHQAQLEMEEQNELLNERLRVMYKNGSLGYLEVLLSADSFSDFVTRFDTIQTIMEYDFNLLNSLEEKRDEMQVKKEKIQAKQQKMVTLKNQLEAKNQEVKALKASTQDYANKLDSDLSTYEQQYKQLERDAQEVTKIIQQAQQKAQQKAQQEPQQKSQQKSNNSTNNSTNTNRGSSSSALSWPVPGHTRISSPYGWRVHPIFGSRKFHTGIDIPAPTGTPAIAAGSGTITYAGYMGGYGNVVIVDLGGGISTLQAHNSSLLVSVGQKVSKGQTIAKVGSTGNSTGPHSHFEVRINGDHTSPLPYVR